MTSITLHHINAPRKAGSVTTALRELAMASHHLTLALLASLTQRRVPTQLTVREEADNLRAMADGLALKDTRFAQDLYAAADRHERGASAD